MEAYFDNASTSFIKPEVFEAMKPFFLEEFGNPSSLHKLGIKNRKFINSSRKKIAELLGCNHTEIYFTSCGTESINWALKGMALKNRTKSEIITTKIEHHATLETCTYLASRGYTLQYVDTDSNGFVDVDHLESLITENTLFVSIIMANNEIGTIQNFNEISEVCNRKSTYLHIDAVQAVCHTELNIQQLEVDFLSISGHKFNAPKGIGILYIKDGIEIDNLLHGGKQEHDKRAGTENVAFIAGITKALELGLSEFKEYKDRLNSYSMYILSELDKNNIDYILNGPEVGDNRLPGNLNLSFRDLDGDTITFYLNKQNVFVSTGSACDSTSIEPSHVVSSIGVPKEYINATIRISLGYQTTKEELEYGTNVLIDTLKQLKDE